MYNFFDFFPSSNTISKFCSTENSKDWYSTGTVEGKKNKKIPKRKNLISIYVGIKVYCHQRRYQGVLSSTRLASTWYQGVVSSSTRASTQVSTRVSTQASRRRIVINKRGYQGVVSSSTRASAQASRCHIVINKHGAKRGYQGVVLSSTDAGIKALYSHQQTWVPTRVSTQVSRRRIVINRCGYQGVNAGIKTSYCYQRTRVSRRHIVINKRQYHGVVLS